MPKPDFIESLRASYDGSGETLDEGTADEAEATEEFDPDEDGSTSSQPDVALEDDGNESEALEGTDDVPTSYFEVDLSGLPAEVRAEIIAGYKERDDQIGKLLRGKSKDDGQSEDEPADETPAPEPITDDTILQALKLDPENPFDETAIKVAIPLVRSLQALEGKVNDLVQRDELSSIDREWNGALDKLEKDNGELPIDRLAVLEFAASNGIGSPTDAYWRIAGPGKRQVEAAVKAAQAKLDAAKTASKKASSSSRPRTSNANDDYVPEGKTMADALPDAMGSVMRALGIEDN